MALPPTYIQNANTVPDGIGGLDTVIGLLGKRETAQILEILKFAIANNVKLPKAESSLETFLRIASQPNFNNLTPAQQLVELSDIYKLLQLGGQPKHTQIYDIGQYLAYIAGH